MWMLLIEHPLYKPRDKTGGFLDQIYLLHGIGA
jgi:hypothetical protein